MPRGIAGSHEHPELKILQWGAAMVRHALERGAQAPLKFADKRPRAQKAQSSILMPCVPSVYCVAGQWACQNACRLGACRQNGCQKSLHGPFCPVRPVCHDGCCGLDGLGGWADQACPSLQTDLNGLNGLADPADPGGLSSPDGRHGHGGHPCLTDHHAEGGHCLAAGADALPALCGRPPGCGRPAGRGTDGLDSPFLRVYCLRGCHHGFHPCRLLCCPCCMARACALVHQHRGGAQAGGFPPVAPEGSPAKRHFCGRVARQQQWKQSVHRQRPDTRHFPAAVSPCQSRRSEPCPPDPAPKRGQKAP